jgi:hypothetical protein
MNPNQQLKWKQVHKEADTFIATKEGKIILAVYKSPERKLMEEQQYYLNLLQRWAESLKI